MVKRGGPLYGLKVQADGKGQVGHSGSALLLAGVADRVGLTDALSAAMAPTRKRKSRHDPGFVLRDLAVMLADGGTSLSDLAACREQEGLFGCVASDATAFRAVASIDAERLVALRRAVALARAQAAKLGVRPGRGEQDAGEREQTTIDIDASLTTAHSNKEQASGNFKKGFGHHPMLSYLDETGEALSGMLRPGNAGSNTAEDHVIVLDQALAQLDQRALDGDILVRGDGAGATHELVIYCREADMRFSFGFALTENVRLAFLSGWDEKDGWVQGIHADGSERRDSQVKEITDLVSLSEEWGPGTRLIARRTKLRAGEQQSFADHDGYRFAVFTTDQSEPDIRVLDLTHRGHARVEDRIREGKDCGLRNLPFKSFAHNKVWLWLVQLAQDLLAWARALCLQGEARGWEVKRLRYRLLHQSGRLVRHARQRILRLSKSWRWAATLAAAFARLQALPDPSLQG